LNAARALRRMTGAVFSSLVMTISTLGYAGVVGLMALESACIPLPSEVIMPFAGYLASTGRFSLIGAAFAGAIGCNVGSTAAYLVGAYGGRAAVLRWGGYVLLNRRELERVDNYFARYGGASVFIARLLPIVRTFISLPAGITHMPFVRFQIYTFVGSCPWCFALAYLGYRLGKAWNTNPAMQRFFQRFDWVVVGLLAAGFAYYIYNRWRAARM
jgi:membrane protein DedA with SNARE-associated domain